MRIAILEDTVKQAHSVANWLHRAGYESVIRHDGDSFVSMLENEPADMLLLDWDVPGKCGIEVLKWARTTREHAEVPIIMLTQHDDESSIVQGLDSGADDYLVKPAREQELVARIRAQARKYYPEALRDKKIKVGRYTMDADARSVLVDGVDGQKLVNLPVREFDLAMYFFRKVGCVVTKEELCEEIWGENDRKYDATLATYVSKLRHALQLRAKNGMLISTVYNHGYRLEELPQAGRRQAVARGLRASAPRTTSIY
ncbi:response regulator transcription factor [Dyella nitratireducens]|uniref:DNA-binding response regulator n=1 Tax=Dyella nitratireducens TaxID=1849580 RepID=A0ABQ1G0L9_9GAMM|nr:response regulator transcription factor [Dyella nitratireducens]GGA35098.1 DNA-binding response regulator [Dyella nitratireducens]GLQ40950.1 DNA-binding response regulator [Dyella nitratireducens]